ncbi:hypothetical protein LAZ67_20000679 [Cordylochernes scorpioides]|uniref:Uncharacterized protein n=1 Tax=Cordylochernes scorpioides TaxID=51811 RepID=A0ABY6LKB8_9ARAC|nr:hypothetical protein LAZ67_20000679 [Cordylochernes scorpioides]
MTEVCGRYGLSRQQVQEGLPRISMRLADSGPTWCGQVQRSCRPSRYRSADGSCNNLEFREWGRSFTALQRFLPPAYADGMSEPRIAQDRGPMPSAREVSMMAVPDRDVPDARTSLMLMQWAQFVDHDLTLTTLTRSQEGFGLLCCHPEIQSNPRLMHPACLPITIPTNDPFYGPLGQTCMEFVRSLPAPRPDCTLGKYVIRYYSRDRTIKKRARIFLIYKIHLLLSLTAMQNIGSGPREQMNQLTAYLDGSNVYGSTQKQSQDLREMEGGKWKI